MKLFSRFRRWIANLRIRLFGLGRKDIKRIEGMIRKSFADTLEKDMLKAFIGVDYGTASDQSVTQVLTMEKVQEMIDALPPPPPYQELIVSPGHERQMLETNERMSQYNPRPLLEKAGISYQNTIGGIPIHASNFMPANMALGVGTVCRLCGKPTSSPGPCSVNYPYMHQPSMTIFMLESEDDQNGKKDHFDK